MLAGIVSYAEYKELLTSVAALALQTICFHGQVSSVRHVCGVPYVQGHWTVWPTFSVSQLGSALLTTGLETFIFHLL